MSVSYSRTAFHSFLRLGQSDRDRVCNALMAAEKMADDKTADGAAFADRSLPGGAVSRMLENDLHVVFTRTGDKIIALAILSHGGGPALDLMNGGNAAAGVAATTNAGTKP